MTFPVALTIAGSDSGGGAGIQGDLKTFAALGIYGVSVVTALTAQNTRGVAAIHDVPPDFVRQQMDAVFSDFAVGAVKIGMLSNRGVVDAVAAALPPGIPTVLDPVMVATSGDRLLAPDAVAAIRERLIPRALLLTPNLPEAAALLGLALARDEAEMQRQGEALLALGAGAVLMKGGHASGTESVDLLVERERTTRLPARRIATENTHGTGCALSSAVAAGLARGLDLLASTRAAKDYVTSAIAGADRLGVGGGHGPLHHFHRWWPESAAAR